MTNQQRFDRLVENALDFLSRAIEELEEQPKFSVIHFHAAVEIFLKARLLYEHWTLVIAKGADPDRAQFEAGNFPSVSLDEAANRLRKVVGSGLSARELGAFDKIAKHRNKMMHFFHEAESKEEGAALVRDIVKEQLTAWYSLDQLLTQRWKDVFSSHQTEIVRIGTALKNQHEYLQVIFESKSNEIEALVAAGIPVEVCPSCGFTAQRHEPDVHSVYEARCLVCDHSDHCLRAECPSCESAVVFRNEGFAICGQCQSSIEPEDLAKALIDEGAAHIAAMDGDYSWGEGNCSDCDGHHTVVKTVNDEWICASCLGNFDELQICDWCNEPNTGDMEQSYVAGCNHCEGMAGWHRDD
ncbi:MAG: hypothetical protein JJU26_13460 [Oceanicaulis sp.]|nr:hypothetical protein [Oceanicaulis sp.]